MGSNLVQKVQEPDHGQSSADVARNCASFNNEQRQPLEDVMQSYDQNVGKIFFAHAAGGCGKTFVCNTIAAAIKSSEHHDH